MSLSALRLTRPASVRCYTSQAKYPRPKPGTAERPPYRPSDPLANAPAAPVADAPNLSFIHRPPPSAPSPFSFTTNPVSPLLKPRTAAQVAADSQPLPPFLRPSANPELKTPPSRVSDEAIEKMIQLRRSQPKQFTRGKLAKMYNCSQSFVGLVAALPKTQRKEALKRRDAEHGQARSKWSEKYSIVRAIRAKRRTLW